MNPQPRFAYDGLTIQRRRLRVTETSLVPELRNMVKLDGDRPSYPRTAHRGVSGLRFDDVATSRPTCELRLVEGATTIRRALRDFPMR